MRGARRRQPIVWIRCSCGIADCLAETVRRIDTLGRIGAEEFAVCVPDISLRDGKALAQPLRCASASPASCPEKAWMR
jgi:GGDEF domain-containing protein